jgi:hypothetical protein
MEAAEKAVVKAEEQPAANAPTPELNQSADDVVAAIDLEERASVAFTAGNKARFFKTLDEAWTLLQQASAAAAAADEHDEGSLHQPVETGTDTTIGYLLKSVIDRARDRDTQAEHARTPDPVPSLLYIAGNHKQRALSLIEDARRAPR